MESITIGRIFSTAMQVIDREWARFWLLVLATAFGTWCGPATGQERVRHALGDFEYVATTSGVLIAAPHGTFDGNTDTLAIAIARELDAGYVVAREFVPNRVRINVNRPTERAYLGCSEEIATERAQDVFSAYLHVLASATPKKPLRLYVEIHGNSNQRTENSIEIATVGLSAETAQRVKEGYLAMRMRVLNRAPNYPEFVLRIEPLDRLHYTASCAKKLGIFATDTALRGIHFEFPRAAREGDALQGSAILVADIVRQILRH